MKMQFVQPSSSLSGFVQYYFLYELTGKEMKDLYPEGVVILPNTYGKIGIFFGPPTFKKENQNTIKKNPSNGISGFYTQKRVYFSESGVSMLIVGLQPKGLQKLLNFPAHEINNQNIELNDIIPHFHAELTEKLCNISDWIQRVFIVEQFLIKMFNFKNLNSESDLIIDEIYKSDGTKSIKQLASELCNTERTLRRKFVRDVGINPKLFSNIVRFQKALRLIFSNKKLTISEIAYDLGYFDQAHFIHDFKSFYGNSPKYFRSEKRSVFGKFYDENRDTHTNDNLTYN